MTNTKGTKADVETRKLYAIELLSKKMPDSLVVEELYKKFKRSYQTHRGDVREAKKEIVKEANYSQQEFNYILQQNFDNIQESYFKAKENDNVSAMVGACKTQNSAIRNYVAIKRDLDYPEMWQNQLDNLETSEKQLYVKDLDYFGHKNDDIPF